MITPRKQWLLKVIAGPHQGAEMGIRSVKMLIGSDEECDVVLHDVLVAPQHVELEITPTGITVAPLGGRVYINGKRVRDARQTLPDFAFLSVGGSHIVIGPEGGKWPLLSAADVPDLEKEVEAPAAEEQKTEAPAETPEQAPAASPSAKAVPARSRTAAFVGIAAGVLLLIGWYVAFQSMLGGENKEVVKTQENTKPLDRARTVVTAMGMSDSVKVEESAGRIFISGYVDTEAKQRELQASIREAVPGVHTRIYSLEKIVSTAAALLDDQHLPLTVTSLSEGRLKITGKLTSAEPWIRMRQILQRSVPGIGAIEDGVEIEAPHLAAVVRPAPVPAPAPVPVIIVPQTTPVPPSVKPVTVTPVAPAAPHPDAEAVAEYQVTTDTIDTLESTIATIKVSNESLGFIRLSTGGVYFVGARLPYGGKIARIDARTVTIEEKGTSRTLQQGDLVVKPRNSASSTTYVSP